MVGWGWGGDYRLKYVEICLWSRVCGRVKVDICAPAELWML